MVYIHNTYIYICVIAANTLIHSTKSCQQQNICLSVAIDMGSVSLWDKGYRIMTLKSKQPLEFKHTSNLYAYKISLYYF